MSPLLEVENLSKTFPAARQGLFGRAPGVKALKDVSFSVYEGDILGVVGESGCGKSTLARCIMRLIEPSEGSVQFLGQRLTDHSARDMRAIRPKLQMIFQDPYSSLNPRRTIGQTLAEPLIVHKGMDKDAARAAVADILDEVGLPADAAAKYPHAFSGGQRQRISIARALVLEPELIVADEAVSALDVSVQAQILALLRKLQTKHDLSFLFITHDLGVVRNFCNRMLVMYLGHVVEEGPVDVIMDAPRHPYTKSLIGAVPLPDPHMKTEPTLLEGEIPSPSNPPSGCPFHPRCDRAHDICTQSMPEKLVAGGHSFACHHPIGSD